MKHYVFKTEEEMREAFTYFYNNVKLTREIRLREYILKEGSIAVYHNKKSIDVDFGNIRLNGIRPFLSLQYLQRLIGVHPDLIILYDFCAELNKCSDKNSLLEMIDYYHADILGSLEKGGKVVIFSVEKDLNAIKKRHKELDYHSLLFVFDVLSKEQREYDMNYVININENYLD